MQYMLLLGLKSDIAAKLLNWMNGVLCAGAVFAIARVLLPRPGALLAMAVFLSQPTLRFLQQVTMVELGLTWFAALAVMSFVKSQGWVPNPVSSLEEVWPEQKGRGFAWLFLAAWFLGFANGTKYHGIFMAIFILGWWITVSRLTSGAVRPTRARASARLLSAVAWVTVWTSPWLIKNWLFTGDPVFPMLQSLFPAVHWTESMQDSLLKVIAGHGSAHEHWLNWVYLPLNVSTETSTFGTFTLNPFFLLFLSLIVLLRHVPVIHKFFVVGAGVYLICWAFSSQQVRFLLPVLPQISITVAYVIGYLCARPGLVRAGVVLATVWILLLSTIGQTQNRFSDSALLPYTTGHTDRHEFLRTHVTYYTVAQRANREVAPRNRLMLLGSGQHYYYSCRRARNGVFDRPELGDLAARAASAVDLAQQLRRRRISHFVVNQINGEYHTGHGLFAWSPPSREKFLALWARQLRLITSSREAYLFRVLDGPLPAGRWKTGLPFFYYPEATQQQVRNISRRIAGLLRRGLSRDAHNHAGDLVRLMPQTSHAHAYRAYTSSLLGERKEAIAGYQKAIRLGYPRGDIYYNLGYLLQGEGRSSEALDCMLEAIRLKPFVRKRTHQRALDLAVQQKRYAVALKLGEQLLNVAPEDAALRTQVERLRSRAPVPESLDRTPSI
jgi:tetratricopeptide (TPR) repeat protein